MRTVYAMNGRCPIGLPESMTGVPTDFQLVDWLAEVREWGASRGMTITFQAATAWLGTLVDDFDEHARMVDALERITLEANACDQESGDDAVAVASAPSSPSSSERPRRSAASSGSRTGGERPPNVTA
jgi:hypothetical protein